MKCKGLFRDSNVVFVPAEDNLQRQESQITTYANYHGIKVEMALGLWVYPATQECVRVLKLTIVGESDKPRYESRYKVNPETLAKREEKIERIKSYIEKGLTLQQMAHKEKCTKQAVSTFIRYHNIRTDEDYADKQ